jgi:hypothetical protein
MSWDHGPRLLRRVPMEKLEKSFGHALKQSTIKYYRYIDILNDDYRLHFFTKEVVELLQSIVITNWLIPNTTFLSVEFEYQIPKKKIFMVNTWYMFFRPFTIN